MEIVYYIILVPMVYLAFAVFVLGILFRLVKMIREPDHPAPLQIFPEKSPKILWALHDTFLLPSVRRHNPLLWVFLMLFHICFFQFAFLIALTSHSVKNSLDKKRNID